MSDETNGKEETVEDRVDRLEQLMALLAKSQVVTNEHFQKTEEQFRKTNEQFRETDRRLKELGEKTDQRIGQLVSAIGELISRIPPSALGPKAST